MNQNTPIPYRLSLFDMRNKVEYKCPHCKSPLYSRDESCNCCHKELDWSDSPITCSMQFKKDYDLIFKAYDNNYRYGVSYSYNKEAMANLMNQFYEGSYR